MNVRPRSGPAPIVVARREEAESALAREIVELVKERRRVVLGLATGSTPAGVYRELARLRSEERVDFGAVETFNLDEYLGLPPDHAQTFSRWTRERFHAPLGIAPDRAHLLPSDDYEAEIRDAGGIDLQILGIGRNGHIAFNEPGSTRESRTRDVELHAWTREDAAAAFGGLASVPLRAITMGVATILEARRLRVLAFGLRKAEIVKRVLEDPIGPDVPATYLREHGDLVLWLDREAAATA
jgi:glucosamine-6-phosphate deaminase